jgi:hypothetical protein
MQLSGRHDLTSPCAFPDLLSSQNARFLLPVISVTYLKESVGNMKDIEQILIDFNDKAQIIFISLYEKFKLSAKKLDRTKDNNVFQQQEGKYLATLKYQLDSLALEFLSRNKTSTNISQLNKNWLML